MKLGINYYFPVELFCPSSLDSRDDGPLGGTSREHRATSFFMDFLISAN